MASSQLLDSAGQPLKLGSLLGRGGEAAVYDLAHQSQLVAKIYHRPMDPPKAQKLTAMISHRAPSISNVAAWPISTITDASTRSAVGLIMPKIANNKEIHHLYSP